MVKGDLFVIQLPNPAIGADLSYRLPDSLGLHRVNAMLARFATSATAANRTVNLEINDQQGNLKGKAGTVGFTTASSTVRVVWGLTGTAYVAADLETHHVPLVNCYVSGGDQFLTNIDNLQAGDVLNNIFLWLERLH